MPIVRKILKKDQPPVLTQAQKARIAKLKNRPIDLSDTPEDLDWHDAKTGKFINSKHLPVADDIYQWLQKDGKNPSVYLNEILHKVMQGDLKV